MALTLTADGAVFAFFGADLPGPVHISTDFLFLAYNNESTFHQQLHNVVKIPLNYVETCPKIAQTQPHEPACDRL